MMKYFLIFLFLLPELLQGADTRIQTDQLILGRKNSGNVAKILQFELGLGASNPIIRWNGSSTNTFKYSLNGSTFKTFNLGTDIDSTGGSNGQVLTANGSGAATWQTPGGGGAVTPTLQIFLTGSGTYTLPVGATYIEIEMVGAGGGGGGNGAGGSAGGNTTFGTSFLVANGGAGGGAPAGGGGTGGTATATGGGFSGIALSGGQGTGAGSVNNIMGGGGASSPFGGAGGGGTNSQQGSNAIPNTGSGGGGAGGLAGAPPPGGAGAGGYIKGIITSPSATYAYAIGAGGTQGAAGGGNGGGLGGDGIIIVTEHY